MSTPVQAIYLEYPQPGKRIWLVVNGCKMRSFPIKRVYQHPQYPDWTYAETHGGMVYLGQVQLGAMPGGSGGSGNPLQQALAWGAGLPVGCCLGCLGIVVVLFMLGLLPFALAR